MTPAYIGIDIGGTNIKGGIVSEKGEMIEFLSLDCAAEGGQAVLETTIILISELTQKAKDKKITLKGIGVGTPGVVDEKFGGVIDGCPNIKGWRGIKFMPVLKEKFNLPVFSHNDATIMANGELCFGAAKGKQDVICITLGTGIGGGIIVGGKVYDGVTRYAGEVGHMIIVANGRACNCGSFGCWETYASATGIIKNALEAIKENPNSILANIYKKNPADINPKNIFDLAQKGDELSIKLFDQACFYIGIGLSNLINIFNPDTIVIGGGISKTGKVLFDKIQEVVNKHGMGLSVKSAQIVPAAFHEKSGVIGAASYAKCRDTVA